MILTKEEKRDVVAMGRYFRKARTATLQQMHQDNYTRYNEILDRIYMYSDGLDDCPNCGCGEMLCGFNGDKDNCTGGN